MGKKNDSIGVQWILFLLMLGFGSACSPPMDVQPPHETDKMEDSMNRAYQFNEDVLTVPPIDNDAPSVVETASFGLG